jgi:hypothetical protein
LSLLRLGDPMELTQMQANDQVPRFMVPLLTAAAELMQGVEALGTARFRLRILAETDARLFVGGAAAKLPTSDPMNDYRPIIEMEGELLIPADDDTVRSAAEGCLRELMRAAGLDAWEPEPEAAGPQDV